MKLVSYFSNETRLHLSIDRQGIKATVIATNNSEYSDREPVELFVITKNSDKWVIDIKDKSVILKNDEHKTVE